MRPKYFIFLIIHQIIIDEIMKLKNSEDELKTILNNLLKSQSYIKRPEILEHRLSEIRSRLFELTKTKSAYESKLSELCIFYIFTHKRYK